MKLERFLILSVCLLIFSFASSVETSQVKVTVEASGILLVTTESATVVVPDDFLTIQEAINSAVEGDTVFVRSGVYYEHVVVNKTVSLVGEECSTTIIDGNGTGRVIDVVSDYVNVTGFSVQRGGSISNPDLDAGISLSGTTDCTISENRLVDNGFAGISLLSSQRNTIVGNNVTGSGWGGVHLMGSSNNTVSGNILDSNAHVGVNGHASSHRNSIRENVISNSRYGMFFHNSDYNHILRNEILDIAVEGIWFQEQVDYNVVAENNLTNCSLGIKLLGPNNNNTLYGNVLTDGQFGICIQNALYTEVYNNTIAHNYGGEWVAGIRLDSAAYSTIHSNLIVDNWRGILLYTSSPHVSIYNNILADNEFAIRVASGGSNYLRVHDNIVMNNRGYGIGLTGFGSASNYATISRNVIVNNSDGIALGQYSSYNTILQNNISQNGYGFYIEYSTQNTIWRNNIVDNDQQAYISASSVNSWDGGLHEGGNFWSDYAGVDSNRDGIGDVNHTINADNVDKYPLMGTFHSFNTSVGKNVHVISNSTTDSFQHEPPSTIRFHVSNKTANQTYGFCRVSIPYEVLSEPFNVTIDGAKPTYWNYNLYDNGTHRWIYFEYQHSTEEVVIIPEISQLIVSVSLFAVSSLLALILRKI